MAKTELSIVVPVYNEAANLRELESRLDSVLKELRAGSSLSFEVIFVDDGSEDGTAEVLAELRARNPAVRCVTFAENRGQYAALMAGLQASRGVVVITLDADLQNPPEEIPRLVEAMEAGHDLVVTRRRRRNDSLLRRWASRLSNVSSSWLAGTHIRDHGCMLCGYSRELVGAMCRSSSRFRFIVPLALLHAKRPLELAVSHARRTRGSSSYSFRRLLRLQLDAVYSYFRLRRERRKRRRVR